MQQLCEEWAVCTGLWARYKLAQSNRTCGYRHGGLGSRLTPHPLWSCWRWRAAPGLACSVVRHRTTLLTPTRRPGGSGEGGGLMLNFPSADWSLCLLPGRARPWGSRGTGAPHHLRLQQPWLCLPRRGLSSDRHDAPTSLLYHTSSLTTSGITSHLACFGRDRAALHSSWVLSAALKHHNTQPPTPLCQRWDVGSSRVRAWRLGTDQPSGSGKPLPSPASNSTSSTW